jgi:hypothetical protein|tara:strand:- start:2135 stop:2431 length:297 start_codon:yes stop_codon:yes gene_type:complete
MSYILEWREVFNSLRRELGQDLAINDASPSKIECSIRHWGNWDYDWEEGGDGDMVLCDSSRSAMIDIVKHIHNKYPAFNVHWYMSEKNWIDFIIIKTI